MRKPPIPSLPPALSAPAACPACLRPRRAPLMALSPFSLPQGRRLHQAGARVERRRRPRPQARGAPPLRPLKRPRRNVRKPPPPPTSPLPRPPRSIFLLLFLPSVPHPASPSPPQLHAAPLSSFSPLRLALQDLWHSCSDRSRSQGLLRHEGSPPQPFPSLTPYSLRSTRSHPQRGPGTPCPSHTLLVEPSHNPPPPLIVCPPNPNLFRAQRRRLLSSCGRTLRARLPEVPRPPCSRPSVSSRPSAPQTRP